MFQGSPTYEGQREPNGFERITDLSSAVGFTAPAGTRLAIFRAETQDIRWRDDGTNPTSTVGLLMSVGDVFMYTGDFSKFKMIETTASAVVQISYYK